MAGKDKKPEIRFTGFTDAWEQHKVGELLIERNTQAPKSEEYPLMAFVAYKGVASKGNRYNREFLVNDEANKKYKQTEYGDFIYSSNNLETGSIGLNNYGKASISPVYSIFQPTELADSDFIGRLLVRKSFINQMVRWRQGVIYGQWRIHESDFVKIEIKAPSVAEQIQIGTFFKRLDNLITLHQRKYDKLVIVKKSMLEKMFPKDGANVPEIRFAGFTDAWEQRKLGEALNQAIEYVNPQAESIELWSLTVENGLTPKTNRYVRDFLVKKEDKFKAVRPNDIVYNPMNMTLGAIGYNNMSKTVAVSGYYITMKPANIIDGYYIKTWMQRPQAINLYKMCATGSLIERQRVQYPTFAEINFSVPEIKEQKKIGAYFRNIDNLITLHQRKLEKLKNIKKSMLEKMFV